jgi:hypothetical protein
MIFFADRLRCQLPVSLYPVQNAEFSQNLAIIKEENWGVGPERKIRTNEMILSQVLILDKNLCAGWLSCKTKTH